MLTLLAVFVATQVWCVVFFLVAGIVGSVLRSLDA